MLQAPVWAGGVSAGASSPLSTLASERKTKVPGGLMAPSRDGPRGGAGEHPDWDCGPCSPCSCHLPSSLEKPLITF